MIRDDQKGFSLIEVLVGMTIGLLGMLVITQVFNVNEASKRTTTSGGDAQQNSAFSLHTIERDIRMAGYGLNAIPALMGCRIISYNATRSPQQFDFTLTGLVINQGAGNLPDEIIVTYSTSSMINSPASLTQSMPNSSAAYKVNNRFGFNPGDLVIAAEPGEDCTLGQVTQVPGGGQSDNVIHNSGNYIDANGNQLPADYNKPGGVSDISYTTAAKLYNLGPMPVSNVYSIANNALSVYSNFTGPDNAELIAENMVDMQAQYGIDTDADGTVDIYQVSADIDGNGTVTGVEWSQVLSARLGLVARSMQREIACDVTTVIPTWAGGTFNNISSNEEWQCYRYRVFETSTVMRNMIWRP